jgi:hypothetical protein
MDPPATRRGAGPATPYLLPQVPGANPYAKLPRHVPRVTGQ